MADATDTELETNHPRMLPALVGHEKAVSQLANAVASGRMHHAWLLCGPRGIGKATLAYRLAAHLLSGGSGGDKLDVDPNSSTARWIASQSHPDLFVLERAFDAKAKRLKSTIAIDDARALLQFFSMTAGTSRWRIAIIDTADDLSAESANALLKIMEEPPPQTLIVLVCNMPGRLLPTIRSRCLRLDFERLDDSQTRLVLSRLGAIGEDIDGDGGESLLRLAHGSPGLAAELLSSGGAKAFSALLAAPSLSPQVMAEIGSRFASRNATVDEYEVFASLLSGLTAENARELALNGGGVSLAEVWAKLGETSDRTLAFNLDRKQAVIEALMLVDRAQKAG